MTDQSKPTPRPWRRFLRFTIRGLIVLVLVIAAGCGWIVRQAHAQRDAVAAITKAGGNVLYDWTWSNGKLIPGGKPWVPHWVAEQIGVDYFGHVTEVSLNARATDETMAHVACLSQVERLLLDESS